MVIGFACHQRVGRRRDRRGREEWDGEEEATFTFFNFLKKGSKLEGFLPEGVI